MRLLLFSDLHGNDQALYAFLEDIASLCYDKIIFCGDIFGYYYHQKEIIKHLNEINSLIWIKGNHDVYASKVFNKEIEEDTLITKYGHSYASLTERFNRCEIEAISKKPSYLTLYDEFNKKILICHGVPSSPLEGRLYPDNKILNQQDYINYDFVILGHTHCRMNRKICTTMIINSGSLGQPRDGNGFGYAILDTGKETVDFKNVKINLHKLYAEIDMYDPKLEKLKNVLER